jgi:hypothetical protein
MRTAAITLTAWLAFNAAFVLLRLAVTHPSRKARP